MYVVYVDGDLISKRYINVITDCYIESQVNLLDREAVVCPTYKLYAYISEEMEFPNRQDNS